MSRTVSPEALAFAERLRDDQIIARRFAEQAEELAAVKEELAALRQLSRPKEERLAERRREEEERKTREQKQREDEARLAKQRAEEAERHRLATEPKNPPIEQIRDLLNATGRLLGFCSTCSHAVEQENDVLRTIEPILDLLLVLPTRITGWPRETENAIRSLQDELLAIIRGWRWGGLIAPPEARQRLVDESRKAWKIQTDAPIKRYAEAWLRAADLGYEEYPPASVMAIAEETRKTGVPYGPFDLDARPQFKGDIAGQPGSHVTMEKLYNDAVDVRRVTPSIGSVPALNDSHRALLNHAVARLRRAIPQPPTLIGWLVGGSTVAS